jgi:hypothetical protein
VHSGAEASPAGVDEHVWADHRKPDAADGVLSRVIRGAPGLDMIVR